MVLSAADSMRLSRKVGYGLRPEENPVDVLGWAMAQFDTVPASVGVASYRQPVPGPWPEKLNWSLEERIKGLVTWKKGDDELDKVKDQNAPEVWEKREALKKTNLLGPYDLLRHCQDAVYSAAPVFERFANFWANHFTVGANGETDHVIGHYTDAAIKANLAGDFASLLYDVETHPAMLSYLDAAYSIGPKSQLGREFRSQGKYADINENLAREMMELHSVSPAAPYTQADIIEAAKVLTGWGYTMQRPGDFPTKTRWHDAFFKEKHEPGDKTVLGQVYPAGKAALRDLTDFLAGRDETRQFISFKLAHHFIREEPTADDVAYIASAWESSGGKLPAIHRAVLERAASETDARKFQQPETWLFQMLRMSGASLFQGYDELGARQLDGIDRESNKILDELGQNNWSVRQPNGFTDKKVDWISPEHMDRRVRFAQLVKHGGSLQLDADDIAARYLAGPATLDLIGSSDQQKFTLLFCSPEFMEA